jgi:hypothetical protein
MGLRVDLLDRSVLLAVHHRDLRTIAERTAQAHCRDWLVVRLGIVS